MCVRKAVLKQGVSLPEAITDLFWAQICEIAASRRNTIQWHQSPALSQGTKASPVVHVLHLYVGRRPVNESMSMLILVQRVVRPR